MAKKGKKKSKKCKTKTAEEEKLELCGVLAAKCGQEEGQVVQAFDDFHAQHPDGVISKEDFLASKTVNILKQSPAFRQDSMMAEALFRVFDDDNSGTFSFEEFFQVEKTGSFPYVLFIF